MPSGLVPKGKLSGESHYLRRLSPRLQIGKPRWYNYGMYYVYVLYSSTTKKLYTGYSPDLRNRLAEHNKGYNQSTKNGVPWRLVWYCGFESRSKATELEQYLKTGSGKAFLYKRLVPEALKKDGA